MAKETGLGAAFYYDGIDLSGDSGSIDTLSKGLDVIPATGIDKFAMERLSGDLDGEISWTSFFNPTNAHLALRNPPRTDKIGMYLHKASVLGTPAAALVAKQINYDGKRDPKGALAFNVQTLANAWWLDWGYSLTTGKRTDTGATNGTGVDMIAALDPSAVFNFGAQFYLQVFAFTGTSATITIQGSTDNGSGDAYSNITGGSFAVVSSAPQSQRIQTARNQAMERWARVVTTGTFSNLVFAVSAVFNVTDMSKL